jgi:hypothetical protein
MTSMQIGVDLAKSAFEITLSTHPGQVADQQRLSRVGARREGDPARPAARNGEPCDGAHSYGTG